MRLNFGKLQIHNFKSFLDEKFDFSSMSGMTLVCGKNHDIPGQANSAGKSSIFDALLYALFGQLQTNVKNKNLKNRYSDDSSMEVALEFNINGKRFFRINRGLNRYGQTVLSLVETTNGVEVDLSKSSIPETESFLENEILCCDVSIFLRTILLSSDQNYNFFLLSKNGKREFVERLFNIGIFGEMYSLVHKDILNFEKEFSNKQTKLMMLNKSKSDFEERMEQHEISKRKRTLEVKNKIDSLKADASLLEKQTISVNKDEISKYEDKINALSEKKLELNDKLKKLSEQEKKLFAKKTKAETAMESDKKKIASYSTLLSKLCSDCKAVVSDYYSLSDVQNHISELEKEILSISTESAKIEETRVEINGKTVKIDQGKALLEQKIHSLTDEANRIAIRVSSLKNEIALNESHLKKLESEENPYKSLLEDTLSKVNAENEELNEMNNRYSYLKMAENIVSQDTLKKFIIKDLIFLLNSKIKYYLMKLGAKYTCVFNDDMDYTFITPDNGGETEYATFSAGERMRLNIATSFAFRDFMSTRNSFTSNILVLDEFIDSAIDTLAVTNILHLLQEFSRANEQHVLIISHRKEIDNSIFDNIVMVEKRNNISTISYLPPER